MNNTKREKANTLLDRMIALRNRVYKDGINIYKKWDRHISNDTFKTSALNLAKEITFVED